MRSRSREIKEGDEEACQRGLESVRDKALVLRIGGFRIGGGL